MKLKTCTKKEMVSKMKMSLTEGRKSLPAIYQTGIDNQNMQGAQKTKLPKY
jgi:hypothetical protein